MHGEFKSNHWASAASPYIVISTSTSYIYVCMYVCMYVYMSWTSVIYYWGRQILGTRGPGIDMIIGPPPLILYDIRDGGPIISGTPS